MRNRSLLAVVVMLMAGMVFTTGIGTGRVNAQDDVPLTASVVSGSCDSPGDTVGDLR
jgi:predicted histidine transporter YuiF (NhaC family)